VTGALDLPRSYELLRQHACAVFTPRDAVLVKGPDTRAWLQGQVSQDLVPLALGDSAETLVLSPQGKVEAYCRATILSDDVVLLDTASGYGAALSQRLGRFRLRVKAELETGVVHCLKVRGPAAASVLATAGMEPGAIGATGRVELLDDPWSVAAVVDWPGYSGFDVLASTAAPPGWRPGDVPLGDPAAFEAARIEAGVPEMGRELTDKTIPQEAGDLVGHAVSLTKGCYTGQELVARLDARGGNVARRLRGVVLSPGEESREGEELVAAGLEVGRVTSITWSPGFMSQVALAYVRRDVTPPAAVSVGPEGHGAEIRELPLKIG